MCCLDVDKRQKFCFVEYESNAAAQKAVKAENGRDFKGVKLSMNIFSFISPPEDDGFRKDLCFSPDF